MSHLQWPLGHVGLRESNLNNNKIPASKALSKFPAKNRPQKFRKDVQPISRYVRQQIDMILCCNDKNKDTHLADYVYVLYKFGLFRGSLETRNYIETAVDVLDFFLCLPFIPPGIPSVHFCAFKIRKALVDKNRLAKTITCRLEFSPS